jgi:hypothetical protein
VEFIENPYFKVVAINDVRQIIEEDGYTEWNFHVTPLRLGRFSLTFRISAIFTEKGNIRKQVVLTEDIDIVTYPVSASLTELKLATIDLENDKTENINTGNNRSANVTGNGNIIIQGVENSKVIVGNGKENKPKEKILFLAANPTDQARIQTDLEYRLIRERLRISEQRDIYELLMPEFALTIENLITAMNQRPAIVHFSGHGETDGIVIISQANKTAIMPEKALQRLFRQHIDSTRLVVLNSCYSVAQAKTISALGFYVIGMNTAVEDGAAISFATGLYIGLGADKSVELAYDDAMIMLETQFPETTGTPEIWKNGERIAL